MSDGKYLLTYVMQGFGCFEWFENNEEMNVFIETVCKVKDYPIIEKTYVKDAITLG